MAITTLYKPGQGYWTRLLSAVGAGVIVLGGVAWLSKQLEPPLATAQYGLYIRTGICAVIVLFFTGLVFYLLNKPRIVEFMIATESEMRKVNWPPRRDTIGLTWIVVCGTIMLAVLLFSVDVIFAKFFQLIGVLAVGR